MPFVNTTLHVTTCLWKIYRSGQIGQVFVLTVSVYIESRYVEHLSKSPSHHTLPPQEDLPANYPESRRVGSPEFNTQVAHVFIRVQVYLLGKSEVVSLCIQPYHTHTYKTQVSLRTYVMPSQYRLEYTHSTNICTYNNIHATHPSPLLQLSATPYTLYIPLPSHLVPYMSWTELIYSAMVSATGANISQHVIRLS